jgi:hypothetical protein
LWFAAVVVMAAAAVAAADIMDARFACVEGLMPRIYSAMFRNAD